MAPIKQSNLHAHRLIQVGWQRGLANRVAVFKVGAIINENTSDRVNMMRSERDIAPANAIIQRPGVRLNFRAFFLAIVIFLTGLSVPFHLYMAAATALMMAWFLLNAAKQTGNSSARLNRQALFLVGGLAIFLTIKACIAVVAGKTGAIGGGEYVSVANFFSRWRVQIVFLFLLFLMIHFFVNTTRETLQYALRIVFAVHVGGFVLQFAFYHAFGQVLDFTGWLGGDSVRTGYFGFFRPTGFFEEPSTVIGALVVLLACDAIIARRISVRMLILVAILGYISFSTAAWMFSTVLLAVILPMIFDKKVISAILFIIVAVAGAYFAQTNYAVIQIAKYNQTSGLRSGVVHHMLYERPSWMNIAGPAANDVDADFKAAVRDSAGRRNLAAAHSLGTAVYLFSIYGALGVMAYLAILLLAIRKLPISIFLLVFLATLTKITPGSALFVALATCLFLELRQPQAGFWNS